MKNFLICLLIFNGLISEAQLPKKVVLMIGDGMGTAQIYAAKVVKGSPLALERCTTIGFSFTHAADDFITDSGAGATAIAIGKKANNGGIGVDADNKPHPTLLEMSERKGMATGLIATSSITHATPASFIAHVPSREMHEAIALDFLKTDIDVFIGGGRKFFRTRKDGRNLVPELEKKGYTVKNSMEECKQVLRPRLACFVAEDGALKVREGRGEMLFDATKHSLKVLSQDKNGFFLMVEGSQIDWGGHANDTDYITSEMLDFDKSIEAVLDFAANDRETLVVITADHETGGFALNGGNLQARKIEGAFTTGQHTGVMVPVFAFGPGAERFAGMYDNTLLFEKIKELLRLR
jgi:alkaline phosphatase